jgi:hypothetical protein
MKTSWLTFCLTVGLSVPQHGLSKWSVHGMRVNGRMHLAADWLSLGSCRSASPSENWKITTWQRHQEVDEQDLRTSCGVALLRGAKPPWCHQAFTARTQLANSPELGRSCCSDSVSIARAWCKASSVPCSRITPLGRHPSHTARQQLNQPKHLLDNRRALVNRLLLAAIAVVTHSSRNTC